jgi:hypothetical protein
VAWWIECSADMVKFNCSIPVGDEKVDNSNNC